MSNELQSRCWLIDFPTHATLLVMMKLGECADDDGTNVFPSVAHVARETQLSPRAVSKQLAILRECGLVADKKDEHGNRVSRTSVVREINIDLMAAVADTRVRGKGRTPSSHVIAEVACDVPAGAETFWVPGALAASVIAEHVGAGGLRVPWPGGPRQVWAIIPRAQAERQSLPEADDADDDGGATPAPDSGVDAATPAPRSGVDGSPPLHQVQGTPEPGAAHPCTTFQQPLTDPSLDPSPPAPPRTGGGACEVKSSKGGSGTTDVGRDRRRALAKVDAIDALIADVLGDQPSPDRSRAVAVLIGPLARQRKIDAPDPAFALGVIAEWASKHPDPVLRDALDRVLWGRAATVKPSDVEAALKAAIAKAKAERQMACSGVFVAGTAQFIRAVAAVAKVSAADAELMRNWSSIRREHLARHGIDMEALR